MPDPGASLDSLSALLREADTVISPHVRDSEIEPALGALVAAGPRAEEAPGEYALLFEAIREGYLLHYGEPRVIEGADPDLKLLTGDYLYALGLEKLASRGDLAAVRELADLISLCAQLHAEPELEADSPVGTLWLAAAVAVGAGASEEHERAKESVRQGDSGAIESLLEAAGRAAGDAGMRDSLAAAADSIGFAARDLPDGG